MNYFFNVYYTDTSFIPTDLYPVQYGEQQCESEHAFGPCVRNNYLLHYVYSGKGILKSCGKEYHISKGQMFLIPPNQLAYYKADKDEPWLYRWIEFNGTMADEICSLAGLSETAPVMDFGRNTEAGTVLCELIKKGDMPFDELMAGFWRFISLIPKKQQAEAKNMAEEYVNKAEKFIKANVHKKITVNNAADYIGVDRSYLTRLFRQYRNTSPQQYILTLKLNTAAQYLKNSNISVSEVAMSVGYSDPHVFTKAFKKHFKISPGKWRKQVDWQQLIKGDITGNGIDNE